MTVSEPIKTGRKQERTVVSLEVVFEGSSGKRQARISDLSLGGCFVDSIVTIRAGEMISLKIKDLEDVWYELRGEVVYIFEGCGFGVRFLSLTENDKIIIEHIILMHGGNPWGAD
jgi:PilZ domain